MLRADFHYELPDDLIARHPTARRRDSRLLHLDGTSGAIADRQFAELPQLLRSGDLLVFNDTRVVPARLFGTKETGGRVELMLERALDAGRALVQLRASKPPAVGSRIRLAGGSTATVTGREDEFWVLDFAEAPGEVFERCGEMPLPPYMKRAAEDFDRERYQTVYAREPGAVAAPTAGLHFDEVLLPLAGMPGSPARSSRCTSAPVLSSRSGRTTSASIACMRNAPAFRPRPVTPCGHAGSGAVVWWRSGPPPCVRSSRPLRQADSMHTPGIHGSSSPPDSSSVSWMHSLPTSTFLSPRC